MKKIDLLKRYSIISLLSTASVKGIFANDIQLVYGYDFDVFSFKYNGTEYYFKFNNIVINGKYYNLTQNEKLAKLVLQKLLFQFKVKIENIKKEIIDASNKEKFDSSKYHELIFKTSITKLNSAQSGNGNYLRVIKYDGKYYKDFNDLQNDNQVYLDDVFRTAIWEEDSHSRHDLYVVNSIKIKSTAFAKTIEDITSISEDKGNELARKFADFCSDEITIESFEEFNKQTDFGKEIIRKFKNSDKNIYYWEVDNALAAGYLDKILNNKVKKLEDERNSILNDNKTFKLKVRFYDNKKLDFEYEYFDVKPQTTYADLYAILLKKCAENLKTTKNFLYTNFNVNGVEIEDIEKDSRKINLDIIDCTFFFTKSEYDKSAAEESIGVVMFRGGLDDDKEKTSFTEQDKENAKKEKAKIEESIKNNKKELEDNKKLISALKSERNDAINSATVIELDIKQDELNKVVEEINKDKEKDKDKKKDEEIKKEDDNITKTTPEKQKEDKDGKICCSK